MIGEPSVRSPPNVQLHGIEQTTRYKCQILVIAYGPQPDAVLLTI